MRHRAAEALLDSWVRGERGPPASSSRGGAERGRRQSFELLRWLEYSGLLVVLAILADAGDSGASVTNLLELSNLCTDTLYSALAIAMGLGFVRLEVIGNRVPVVKRYYLTDLGRQIGAVAQQAHAALRRLPLPPNGHPVASRKGRGPGAPPT